MFLYLFTATAILALVNPLFAIPAIAFLVFLYPVPSIGVLVVLAVWQWRKHGVSQRITHQIAQWRNRK